MPTVFRVTWTVAPTTPPQLWRNCPACRVATPFRSTGAFRTNAQKKRIDIWLIYRCTTCEARWNLPIFERITVNDLPSVLFEAIARDDPATAHHYACDVGRLARHTHRIEESRALAIDKHLAAGCQSEAASLEIAMILQTSVGARLDHVLAEQLCLARSGLQALYDDGVVSLAPPHRKGLRARISNGQAIRIDLSRLGATERDALLSAACG